MTGEGTLIDPFKIKAAERVSVPGVYLMPMGRYHEDCCEGPSISSSGLRTLLDQTPRAYWWGSPYNPERPSDEDTDSTWMRIGRAAHTLVLEPHLFRDTYAVRPAHWDSWRTDRAKKWRAEQIAEGWVVLDPKEYEIINGIAKSLKEHPLFGQGLLEGYVERSFFWKDEETGVWLKSRPDAVPISANIYADMKALSDVRPHRVRAAVYDRGYHVQMALAEMGMERILGRKMEEYVLVAVGQKAPHDILIQPLHPDAIWWGRQLVRKATRIFADCYSKQHWPSYEKESEYLGVPEWLSKRYEADPDLTGFRS